MALLFISDLHLDPSRQQLCDALVGFLAGLESSDHLYILGDLFEVWLGDDHRTAFNDRIIAALRQLPCPHYLMHGNRDFLLGSAFCTASRSELLPEPWLLHHAGKRILLMHGDSLCIDDLDYMKARQQLRDPGFQLALLSRSIEERARFANQARQESRHHTALMTAEITDVNQTEVERVMREHEVDLLIHGHTHRPAIHEFRAEGGRLRRRAVLGDWGDHGWVLTLEPDGDGLDLRSFPILPHESH